MNKIIKLSVHQLVDFLLRTGDIDNRINNNATMAEGSRIHALYQAKQKKGYLSEVLLTETFFVDDFNIVLEGRADGIIFDGEEEATIDEIKSTIAPLEDYFNEQKEWHLGQAKCYALMFAHAHKLDHANIQLTYIHQIENTKMQKLFSYSLKELENDIFSLLREYVGFYKIIFAKTEARNLSAKTLEFPFPNFRGGQKTLAKYCYGIATNGGILFSEAPTGIGKTVSTLFPFAKSFAEEVNEKIFYLTAKNSGKEMAFDTVTLLQENGLKANDILITAKDKICMCPGKACNPDECPYAKGYYTKIRKIVTESISTINSFDKKVVTEIATRNAVCPFELQLDLSLFTDIIVCDYNYFFDPMVYLQRFFDADASNMIVLVDEAHNLIERGRAMYSASFDSFKFKQVRRSLRHFEHKKIKAAMTRLAKVFKEYEDLPLGDTKIDMLSPTSINAIDAYLLASSDVNKHHHSVVTDEFKDFFLDLNKFLKLLEYFDETFDLYVTKNDKDEVKINLFCLDPSKHLKRSFDLVKSKVVFSATLSPADYYIDTVGGEKNDPLLILPSPFKKENLKLLIAPNLSIRYKNRGATIKTVSEYIKEMISSQVGNYFVYVPSYEYLEQIVPYLTDENYTLMVQEKDMSEDDKTAFLSCFQEKPSRSTVGLAVVGGAFGEGIDLVSDRLIGVAVVGVGLPQICYERNLIRDYFDNIGKDGYEYAYVNPGMNKVMQAVGRVIRTDTDRGVALLIDDRLLNSNYRDLFKNEWNSYEVVTSKEEIKKHLQTFWRHNK